ncbi:hypothetical protein ACM66B_004011 [Microbotryomycetes sp. NB124-2]
MARMTSSVAARDSTPPSPEVVATRPQTGMKRGGKAPYKSRGKLRDIITEEGFIPWSYVSTEFRRHLASNEAATVWRNSNLTPNTIFRSFLLNKDFNMIKLFEGVVNGRHMLFYNHKQLNRALRYMRRTPGVPDGFVEKSFDMRRLVPKEAVKQLRPVFFRDSEELNGRLLELRQLAEQKKQEEAQTEAQLLVKDVVEEGELNGSNAVTSAVEVESESVNTSDVGTLPPPNTSLKRVLDASVAYPTPSPSLEGTPEPCFDLPLKKPKLASTESLLAKQAKQSLKTRAQVKEFEATRAAWSQAVETGGATFLGIDFETWEFDHDCLLEVGWSLIEFSKDGESDTVSRRVEHQHIVVAENKRRRNKKFSPDARDHFDFGKSTELKLSAIRNLLHALFSSISSSSRLFLVFHDPRADLKSLYQLGFKPHKLQFRLGHAPLEQTGTYVIDTQSIYSAWAHDVKQRSLNLCCTNLEVPTKRLHNAGNDAVYTRLLLEAMMDTSKVRPEPQAVADEATE